MPSSVPLAVAVTALILGGAAGSRRTAVLSANFPAKVGIAGDARAVVPRLLARLVERGVDNPDRRRRQEARIAADKKAYGDEWLERSTDRVNPARFFAMLKELLAVDAVTVVDDGNHTFLAGLEIITATTHQAGVAEALRVAGTGRPVVVDVAIDYGKRTRFTRGVVSTVLKRFPLGDKFRFVGRAFARKITG